MTSIDWAAVEDAATAQMVALVRDIRAEHPDETVYGALFHAFYGDGTMSCWPMISIGTEETLAGRVAWYREKYADDSGLEDSLRWSGADLPYAFEGGPTENALADAVQDLAALGDDDEWNRTYERFLLCFPAAAARARATLIADGVVGEGFVAIAYDEAGELVHPSVTPEQLAEHFPEYAPGDS